MGNPGSLISFPRMATQTYICCISETCFSNRQDYVKIFNHRLT